ncbi:MAG: hypothetical protein QXH12_01250 [Candidatus Caldarchaeum sp.]|uniref:Uncharacterized protein n=1 Tax=Caldiarchaeum subterraneum TaxID=311458 RepID=A0A7C5L902_CALS0
MSYGYDEFESKLGQFIYTMVMYERLREYILDKLRGKDRLSVRISLGNDKYGNQVFMDVVISAVKPQVLAQQVAAQQRKSKKSLVLVLSNEEVAGERRQIAAEMEKLIVESLKWWHGYFGERDKLKLDVWKSERVEVLEGEVAGSIVELPADRIISPPLLPSDGKEEEQESLAQFADILGPLVVRPTDSDYYELVGSIRLFDALVNRLGYDRVKALVLDVDAERAASMRAEIEDKIDKLVKRVVSR